MQIVFPRGPLNRRMQHLSISGDEILFGSPRDKSSIRFRKEDIADYRYGIHWISGYMFTIGREYRIDIRDHFGLEMRIRMRSFYGWRKKALWKQYVTILEALWEHHFKQHIITYLDKLESGNPVKLCGVQIYPQEGIEIPARRKRMLIEWAELGTKEYQTYYAIFNKRSSIDINFKLDYMSNWNATVLSGVLETWLHYRVSERPTEV